MYISHKSNVIQQVHEQEWQCRRMTKGLDKPEYWAWLDSVTTVTGTAVTTARNVTCATLDNISFEVFYQCYQTAPWTYTITGVQQQQEQ